MNVTDTIALAARQMKTVLLPHLYIHSLWVGDHLYEIGYSPKLMRAEINIKGIWYALPSSV